MAHKTIQHNNITWYYFSKVVEEDLHFLQKEFKFHPLTVQDVTSESENPKIDVFKNYIFGVFHFPEIKKNVRRVVMHEVDMYVGKDYVIMIQESNYRVMRDLFFKVANSAKLKKEFFSNGSNFLFYSILNTMFTDSNEPIINYTSKNLQILEKQIYEVEDLKTALRDIGVLRRNILNFKRIMVPQAKTVNQLTKMNNDIITSEFYEYYDDIDDYIEKVWSIINNHQEVVDGLHLTAESLISFRTNEVIKLLTIISVGILPLTLFTGLYGMNIDLPFQSTPSMVWTLLGVLIIGIFGSILWILRKNR